MLQIEWSLQTLDGIQASRTAPWDGEYPGADGIVATDRIIRKVQGFMTPATTTAGKIRMA